VMRVQIRNTWQYTLLERREICLCDTSRSWFGVENIV
jgi:hypothetical protein